MTIASANSEPLASSPYHTGYASTAETEIFAPPEVIWPHLLDTGCWIFDFHFQTVSGPVGGEGEVRYLWPDGVETGGQKLSVRPEERTPGNASVMKTLALVPHKLWHTTMPLKGDDTGASSHGANIVILTPIDGATRVTAIRTKEWYCPDQDICDTLASTATAYQPVAQSRWTDLYLPRLKSLSEQSWAAGRSHDAR